MPGIRDVLTAESLRDNEAEWLQLHLFEEGTFYRAYEVSAWLCTLRIKEFKPTHRIVKGLEQTVIFIGFPVVSLQNYIPEDANVVTIAPKHLLMQLPPSEEFPYTDVVQMNKSFLEWKNSVPQVLPTEKKRSERKYASLGDVSTSSSAADLSGSQQGNDTGLFIVAQKLMSFPLESKTPLDCMVFLSELKTQITKLL